MKGYFVLYPSGRHLLLPGYFKFSILTIDGEDNPMLEYQDDIFLLDARVIISLGEETVYSPHENLNMPEAFQDWVKEHPDWGKEKIQ